MKKDDEIIGLAIEYISEGESIEIYIMDLHEPPRCEKIAFCISARELLLLK